MADIGEGGGGHQKKGPGVKKAKKKSTQVDLTPMVDLGFLLITFFVFTTTMSQSTAMQLNLPKDTDDPVDKTKIKESGALTLLLSKDRNVYYYNGILTEDGSNFKSSNFTDIRNVILEKKRGTPADDLVIVIKANDEATLKDAVDILDEMKISDVERYALVDIAESEKLLINATEGVSAPAATTTPTTPK